MVDPIVSRRWLFRLLFVAISALVLFFNLMPVDLSAGRWPGPDLMVAVAFAWVMRRPDYVPAALVGLVLLVADIFFMRPPGLWAGLGVVGLEFLRSREQFSRDLPFPIEMVMVAAVLAGMALMNRVVLFVFVVDQPAFGLEMLQLLATIVSYPLVVGLSRVVFGIRKIAPGEVDQLGHRI